MEDKIKIKKVTLWQAATAVLAVLLIISIMTHGFNSDTIKPEPKQKSVSGYSVLAVNDKRCGQCDISGIISQLQQLMPELEVNEVDYSSEQGRELYNDLDLKVLPALLFGQDIEEHENYGQLANYMEEKGDYLSLRIGASYDPTAEICNNGEDDNEDGKADCADAKCKNHPACNKQDVPKMTVWIESMCPFGVQAINGLARVYEALGDKAKIEVRYMVSENNGAVSAMHGPDELAEDKRHVCIREEQGEETFWKYLRCYAETGKAAECEAAAGVDSDKLAACVEDKAVEYLTADAKDWSEIYRPAGGGGSPSFFLNDFKINEFENSQEGRSPDNLRNIICSNMETRASECDAELPATNPPRGFGVIEEGTSVGGGNC
jgi:hypothetical protein